MVTWHNVDLLALMSTQEQSWHHGDIFSTHPECPQMLMSAHDCSLVLIAAQVLDLTKNKNVNF